MMTALYNGVNGVKTAEFGQIAILHRFEWGIQIAGKFANRLRLDQDGYIFEFHSREPSTY